MKREITQLKDLAGKEGPPDIVRTTMAYNEQGMLCHFDMHKGARIPMHNHPAVQIGYVISGRVRFFRKDKESFEAVAGTSYAFDTMEEHGAEVLEDSEVVECFTPLRKEYVDNQ